MKHLLFITIAIVIALISSVPVIADQAGIIPDTVNTFSCADVSEIPQVECEALVALYNSTNGDGWIDHRRLAVHQYTQQLVWGGGSIRACE